MRPPPPRPRSGRIGGAPAAPPPPIGSLTARETTRPGPFDFSFPHEESPMPGTRKLTGVDEGYLRATRHLCEELRKRCRVGGRWGGYVREQYRASESPAWDRAVE